MNKEWNYEELCKVFENEHSEVFDYVTNNQKPLDTKLVEKMNNDANNRFYEKTGITYEEWVDLILKSISLNKENLVKKLKDESRMTLTNV